MSEIEKISKRMSWGTVLWDQFDNLSTHTNKGIQLLDKFGNFVRDRIQIEEEYTTKLRKLEKSYQTKKIEDEDLELTTSQAFCCMLKEIGEIASRREVFVESLKQKILEGIFELSTKLHQERKACLHDYTILQHNLNLHLGALERSKRHYEKAFLESKKAIENYKKADLDLNLSRAEVYRCNNLMHTKVQDAEDAKVEYAKQLQKTNSFQEQHYAELLPAVLNRLELFDQRRSCGTSDFMMSAADIEIALMPELINCLTNIKEAAEEIDEEADSNQIMGKLRTGLQPPTDISFEDLAKQKEESALPVKNTKSGNTFMKDVALFKIYKNIKQRRISEACLSLKNFLTTSSESDLTPNRRKKLHIKIGEIHKKLKKETDTYNDLIKMNDSLDSNATSADSEKAAEHLKQLTKKIEKLKADLTKYQSCLEKPHELPKSSTNSTIHLPPREKGDISDMNKSFECLVPESNVSKVKNWLEKISEADSQRPEISLATSRTSIFDSGKGSVNEIMDGVAETEIDRKPKIFYNLYSNEENCEENLSLSESEAP